MSVPIGKVRELRERSGAGMLDCQAALVACDGNMDEAMVYLQKKGLADAQTRRGRATERGRIFIAHNPQHAIILELLCETDFVARNDTFVSLGNDLAAALIDISSPQERAQQADTLIKQGIGIIKENIQLRRHEVVQLAANQRVGSYIHGDDGALGALVVAQIEPADTNEAQYATVLHDMAMHVSACRPLYVSTEQVPAEYRERQMKIFTEQAKGSGKPDNITAKIAAGKLSKHFGEICLLEQGFVKEEKKRVRDVLAESSARMGRHIEIVTYHCYKAGEQEQ